jgi:hypothetical protein
VAITFSLYEEQEVGTALWSETQNLATPVSTHHAKRPATGARKMADQRKRCGQ